MSEPATPQEKIIMATIACIEKDGIQSLTNRMIAREAGVNSAAINYYFGSKDRLIDAVMNLTLNEMNTLWGEAKEAGKGDNWETLRNYLFSLLEGGFRYPGITRAHLFSNYFYPEINGSFMDSFLIHVPELVSCISEVYRTKTESDARILAFSLLSSILLPSLLPELYSGVLRKDFSDAAYRTRYLDTILKSHLPA